MTVNSRAPQDNLANGGTRFFAITPDDDADLAVFTRGILLSADATVRVTGIDMADDEHVDLPLVGKVWHPGQFRRIWDTGTGAVTIIGCR